MIVNRPKQGHADLGFDFSVSKMYPAIGAINAVASTAFAAASNGGNL